MTATATTPTRGATLELRGIQHSYGDVAVVKDVSLSVAQGEFVTLLGASGSGKTTLLRIVAGFLQNDAGQILIGGVDTTGTPVHKRRIGMVFQNYALFPHMSVRKNVMFPLARQGFPRRDRAALVQEALDAVHLGSFADRMPRELSGGQQQRVALARAIVSKPQLLLMDEPLGALDRRLRESLQIEVRRLSTELGVTVINVTHDQEEALTMSDRIALLENGSMVQFGTPQELFNSPNSVFTASFLGESTILPGVVAQDAGELVFVPDGDASELRVLAPTASGSGREPAPGDRGSVMIRPWGIYAQPWDAELPDERVSWVAGTVTAVIFTGDSRKLLVRSAAGVEFTVRSLTHLDRGAEVGDRVRMLWAPTSSILLDR